VLAFAELSEDDEQSLEGLLGLARAQPWTVADLPESLRQRLVAADGSSLFVFVWPNDPLNTDYISAGWIAVLDALIARIRDSDPAGNGGDEPEVQVLDERRLPLAVVDLVRRDLSSAMTLAALLVILALIVHFRRWRPVVLTITAIALAMILTLAVLVVSDMHVNLYNAVLLPCIVGIGMDNAIHILHAYTRAGPGSLRRVLATTGVAVMLASLTTAIGFGATIIARQGGLRSMGLTAAVGALCAFALATIVLPAALRLLERPQSAES
ncbi:MAG: MMPL family transporter, partial [Myxococcota bacterium]